MFDPFHSGERAIQARVGALAQADLNGRLIGRQIPAGARAFLAQQSCCVLGRAAPEGDIWAAFLTGKQGFAGIDMTGAVLSLAIGAEADPARAIPPLADIRAGDRLGLLFIELATRRRLRVNGSVAEPRPSELSVNVAEAFPNCPKYIQQREASVRDAAPDLVEAEHGESLDERLAAWIAAADTFFVASAYPDGPVDCSHRGGNPGFVELAGGKLRIPDYPGNSMFGTLGNFAVNPRAGLVFVDFANSRQLQLTGDVELDFAGQGPMEKTGGTGRWWVFSPRRWIVSSLSHALDWRLIDRSPFNP